MMEYFEAIDEPDHSEPDQGVTRRKKKLIKSSVTIHDQTQIETAFDYRIRDVNKSSNQQKKIEFQVEAWFFFPNQMAGGLHDLTRGKFYQDLRPMMRFREARYTYKEFMGLSKKKIESPIEKIRKIFQDSDHTGLDSRSTELIYLARMSACSYSSWLLRRVNRRCKNIRKSNQSGNQDQLLSLQKRSDELFKRGRLLLLDWHQLVQDSYGQKVSQEVRNELLLAEEYCHYRFREGLAKIILCLQNSSDSSEVKLFLKKLKKWTRWQWLASKHLGLRWIDQDSHPIDQERFMNHLSYLKKNMWQVLYLEVTSRKIVEFRKQLGYMLAAGFAALWAFMANFLIWKELQFGGFSSLDGFDGLIGMSGLLITLAFVFSYILKDRIKELGRSRLSRGILGDIPDYSEKITAKNMNGESFKVGIIREWVHRVQENKKIPEAVKQIRSQLPGEWAATAQQVLYYRKRVTLHSNIPELSQMPIEAVRDITRFNIRRHLARLDDPLQKYLRLSRKGNVMQILVPKSYCVDLILNYSSRNNDGKSERMTIDGNRLVINKEGLQRIDQI